MQHCLNQLSPDALQTVRSAFSLFAVNIFTYNLISSTPQGVLTFSFFENRFWSDRACLHVLWYHCYCTVVWYFQKAALCMPYMVIFRHYVTVATRNKERVCHYGDIAAAGFLPVDTISP